MDVRNAIITLLLGFIVILFYAMYLPKNSYAWGGITDATDRRYIMISILLAGISYLVVWTRQVFVKPSGTYSFLFTIGNIIFLAGALLWPLFLHLFPSRFHWVIVSLCITSLGALILLAQQIFEWDFIGIIFALYLFFHVFVMDNIFWASSFRSLFPQKTNHGW